MKMKPSKVALLTPFICSSLWAATPIDLSKQTSTYLINATSSNAPVEYRTYRRSIDFNGTIHSRIQQTYHGVPVWDATGVIHQAKSNGRITQNGVVYEGLANDLLNTPKETLAEPAKINALAISKSKHFLSTIKPKTRNEKSELIIFIDDRNIAHYAYLTRFSYDDPTSGEHKQMSIVDAKSKAILKTWNAILTEAYQSYSVQAGGIGGNPKEGEVIYDGTQAPTMTVSAIDFDKEDTPGMFTHFTLCELTNDDITVEDVSKDNKVVNGVCSANKTGGGFYWLSLDKGMTRWNDDEVNQGYSPSLDALYAATMIKQFYHDWYGVPALIDESGAPKRFIMRVHYGRQYDNANWDGEVMTFGDGGQEFYPLTSVGVAAHEIGHGFTDTHSHIDASQPQMAALHESFSDMAAVTLENYMTGSNHWDIGREIKKDEGALRYLDNPRKDGYSFDNLNDYENSADPNEHHVAGITNKAFYLLATTHGWNTRRAFNVMLQANMYYWTSSMKTFNEAACGVIQATKDYGYDVADVRIAFAKVGVMTDQCV